MSIARAKIYLNGLIRGAQLIEDLGKHNTADSIKRQCEKILKELEDVADEDYLNQKIGEALDYLDATVGITDSDNTNIDLVKELLSEVLEGEAFES